MSQIANLCNKEAKKAGYIVHGWLRGGCQGLDTLEARHDEMWAAWQAFRDADPALSRALDHRCLIGQKLHEVFLSAD